MSKFFYKGRMETRDDFASVGYQTRGANRYGTEQSPLTLSVASEERKAEVEAVLKENGLFANIAVNDEVDENITELEVLLHKPETVVLEKTPKRNDPCSCDSGKKYKKCCGA